jgi:hypothetical protein
MFGTDGQLVRSIDDAEKFIHTFLRFEREHRDELAKNKEHDYDLYLPWLMEVVVNATEVEESRPPAEFDALYMDAAWSLVLKGCLRPGPRRVTGDAGTDGYGKGFALTAKGQQWLNSDNPI